MIVKSPAGRVMLIAGVLVLSLTACGRRGPPEAPPAAAAADVPAAEVRTADPMVAPPIGGARPAEDLQTLPSVPDRPFILDGLL
jgi:predicted small lipoprotein YifL